MGRGKVPADWPPITVGEAARVLANYPDLGLLSALNWRSPRPLSAAALVATGAGPVFIKRHHRRVRSAAALHEEHDFAAHLRSQRVSVPRVLRNRLGRSVVEEGEWVYEVHEAATGLDAYRDVLSWEPYRYPEQARSAGAALARLHRAAAGYGGPKRTPSVLSSSDDLVRADDPQEALDALVQARPPLAAALSRWPWRADCASVLWPALAGAAAALARVESQWGHGDWHPSNLTWSGQGAEATVVSVMDLGLSNRTSAVHDVAVALERAMIGWLDLEETGEATVDFAATRALLEGYLAVRPLDEAEAAALVAVLPVVHVDFALSEVEYFSAVVRSPGNAELAYRGYLLGHAQWFATARSAQVLLESISSATAAVALPHDKVTPAPPWP